MLSEWEGEQDILTGSDKESVVTICHSQGSHAPKLILIYCVFPFKWDNKLIIKQFTETQI